MKIVVMRSPRILSGILKKIFNIPGKNQAR